MWRFGKRWILGLLVATFIVSLALAQLGSLSKPTPTFYLLPTRGWELLIGSFIAFYFHTYRKKQYSTLIAQSGSLAGISLIIFALFYFDNRLPFPSFYTLVPTLGAALIIVFANQTTLVGKLLGSKPLVAIGLMSYSAYLWHQPLFAFARYRSLAEPSLTLMGALSVVVFLLAFLSWRFVERPFRNKKQFSANRIFTFGLIASVFFICIGLIGHLTDGYIYRSHLKKRFEIIEVRFQFNQGLSPACNAVFSESPKCRTNDNPEVILWGDSFAMHLMDGFLASKPTLNVIQATFAGCGPFFDVAPISLPQYGAKWAKECMKSNDKVRDYLRKNKSIKYVVLSSPFKQYFDSGSRLMKKDGSIVNGSQQLAYEYFSKTLHEIELMGKKPVVFSYPPTSGFDTGACLLESDY